MTPGRDRGRRPPGKLADLGARPPERPGPPVAPCPLANQMVSEYDDRTFGYEYALFVYMDSDWLAGRSDEMALRHPPG